MTRATRRRRWREYFAEQDCEQLRLSAQLLAALPIAALPLLLPTRLGLALFAPYALVSVITTAYRWRARATFLWWITSFATACYAQVAIAAAALWTPDRATELGALLVLAFTVNGARFQHSARRLYGPLAAALPIAALWMLRPNAALAVAFVSGIVAGLLAGSAQRAVARLIRQNRQLREALAATDLERKHADLLEVSHIALEMLGHMHDMRNALMAAKLETDCLEDELSRPDPQTATLKEIARDLTSAVDQLQQTVDHVRRIAKGGGSSIAKNHALSGSDPSSVPIYALLEEIRSSVAELYRSQIISIEAGDAGLRVRCIGGNNTLRRVFENLMINACQGDGEQAAQRVQVRVTQSDPQWVEIEVADDGPGFPAIVINDGVHGMITTKPEGNGIGLFTSEHLVSVCGGTLRIANAPGGGASAIVRLPKEPPVPA